jgi:hypothetical protein
MKSRFHRSGWAVGLAAVGLLACKDETPNFAGGPLGIPARLEASRTSFNLPMGSTAEFAVQVRDSARNHLSAEGVTATSCNTGIATVASATAPDNFNAAFTVTAVAPGTTCITVSGGGLSDSAGVSVGPARIVIAGPDTASSGCALAGTTANQCTVANGYVFRAYGLDANGNALPDSSNFPWTWSQSDGTLFAATLGANLNRHPGDTVVFTSPGNTGIARVMVTTIGGATAVRLVTVGPSPFDGGTIVPNNVLTRPGVDELTVTRPASTALAYDANSVIFVDDVATFWTTGNLGNTPQGSLTTGTNVAAARMPPITRTGVVPVTIGRLGGNNVWRIGSITAGANATNTADASEPANNAAATTTNVLSTGAAGTTNFYLMLVGGDCSAGVGGGTSDCVDWFTYTNTGAAPRTVTIQGTWFTATDIDVNAFANDGTTSVAPTSGSTRGLGLGNTAAAEAYDVPVAAGATIRIRVRMHAANGVGVTFARLRLIVV